MENAELIGSRDFLYPSCQLQRKRLLSPILMENVFLCRSPEVWKEANTCTCTLFVIGTVCD